MAEKQLKTALTHEEALEAGFFGTVPDETPNDAYTVAGVTGSDTAAKADSKAAKKAKAEGS